ncbi:hypothetical protein NP233_g9027 [Leucocoprinus birnbaumii]|uniref:DNA polymerase eta n=1 Tax=Leucocoprinus birnbaumii TaxID=56174 RepID=A0AAD5YML1_9AGAR|nr:hypothetical protein NP233_g9027 [Leucocoprinus birnbaumii]
MTSTAQTRPNLWKGKAKATSKSSIDSEFIDLEPLITYRHILSNNLGVKDPLRVVALCDSDAFYAACEMVRLNVDKEIPLVVLQWDSLIAVNYPARKYGITRMIKVKEALKKCPHLKVVHVATYKEGDSEPGYWENIAAKFKENLPSSVEMEKASIDEAFFDYTKPVKEILLQRYPYLAQIPRDSPNGIDTPLPPPPRIKWSDLDVAHLIPLNGPRSKEEEKAGEEVSAETTVVEPAAVKQGGGDAEGTTVGNGGASSSARRSVDEVPTKTTTLEEKTGESHSIEETGEYMSEEEQYTTTWHDVALAIAAELMDQARGKVREMGYTTSAGIARNKFLAKLSASYKKPNSQSILRNTAIPAYLRPLPFQKIRFLGGKLGSALAKEYEVSTVGDLLCDSVALYEAEEMQRKFGEGAIWVYEVLRGIDRSEGIYLVSSTFGALTDRLVSVKEKSIINKSMLAAKNLPKPIKNGAEGHHWIRVLAAELALRLKDARESSPNLWPKTLVLNARKGLIIGSSWQRKTPIRMIGFDANTGYENGRSKQAPFPFVRQPTVDVIASAADKLWKELVGTAPILNVGHVSLAFTGIEIAEQGQKSIEGFLKPASASSPKKRLRDEEIDMTVDQDARTTETSHQDNAASDVPKPEHQSSNHELSYSCSRCGKTFLLPDNLSNADNDIRQEALFSIRLEHQDFHFAEDLMNTSEERPLPVKAALKKTGFKPGSSKRQSRKESQGIDKYFTKK